MYIIRPIDVLNDSSISYTTTVSVPDAIYDPAVWSAATSYPNNSIVVDTLTNRMYQNVSGGSVSGAPAPSASALLVIPKWIEIGMCNGLNALNYRDNTNTIINQPNATYTVTTDAANLANINSINISGLTNVSYINILVKDTSTGTVLYTSTVPTLIRSSTVNSWYTYFFSKLTSVPLIVNNQIPAPSSQVTIELTFVGSTGMTVERIMFGTYKFLGNVLNGASSDILNFSTINRDIYGRTTSIVVRDGAKKLSCKVFIDKARFKELVDLKASLNAVPAVWVGIPDIVGYDSTTTLLGIYREFAFEIDNPIGPMISLEIEEV